jgi:hypothetical protein
MCILCDFLYRTNLQYFAVAGHSSKLRIEVTSLLTSVTSIAFVALVYPTEAVESSGELWIDRCGGLEGIPGLGGQALLLVALAEHRVGAGVLRTEADGLREIRGGLVEPPAAVQRERDLGALGEGVPSLARLERAGEQRGEGGVEGAQRREAVALEVEGEGLEDERRGVAGVEGDGEVGLGDGRAGERAGGLGCRGARAGEELRALREVPPRLGRGGAAAAGAAQAEGGAAGEGVERDEHARGEEEEEALDHGLRPGAGGAQCQGRHGSVLVAWCGSSKTARRGPAIARFVGRPDLGGHGSVLLGLDPWCGEPVDVHECPDFSCASATLYSFIFTRENNWFF